MNKERNDDLGLEPKSKWRYRLELGLAALAGALVGAAAVYGVTRTKKATDNIKVLREDLTYSISVLHVDAAQEGEKPLFGVKQSPAVPPAADAKAAAAPAADVKAAA